MPVIESRLYLDPSHHTPCSIFSLSGGAELQLFGAVSHTVTRLEEAATRLEEVATHALEEVQRRAEKSVHWIRNDLIFPRVLQCT